MLTGIKYIVQQHQRDVGLMWPATRSIFRKMIDPAVIKNHCKNRNMIAVSKPWPNLIIITPVIYKLEPMY